MLNLRERQRAVLVDNLPGLANLVAGATVFGQLLSDRGYSIPIGVVGALLWFLLVGVTIALARR